MSIEGVSVLSSVPKATGPVHNSPDEVTDDAKSDLSDLEGKNSKGNRGQKLK